MIKRIIDHVRRRIANMSQNGKRKYLENQGMKIGSNTVIYTSIENFNTEPFLILNYSSKPDEGTK